MAGSGRCGPAACRAGVGAVSVIAAAAFAPGEDGLLKRLLQPSATMAAASAALFAATDWATMGADTAPAAAWPALHGVAAHGAGGREGLGSAQRCRNQGQQEGNDAAEPFAGHAHLSSALGRMDNKTIRPPVMVPRNAGLGNGPCRIATHREKVGKRPA